MRMKIGNVSLAANWDSELKITKMTKTKSEIKIKAKQK